MKKFLSFPLHTIAFAVFSVVSMFAANYGEINAQNIVRPLVLAILLSVVTLTACYFLFKDKRKAGVIATFLLFFFFVYGHYRDFLKSSLPAHSLLLSIVAAAVWLGLMAVGFFLLVKKVRDFHSIHQIITVIVFSALLLPLLQIGSASVKAASFSASSQKSASQSYAHLQLAAAKDPPDIYFFVLDSYGRQDVLQNLFGYDNKPFLDQLKKEGFYVAACSLSNYNRTALSITSTLDYEYIQNLGVDTDPSREDRTDVWYLFKHNRVISQLKEIGYKTVAFETGYDWSSLQASDYYFRAKDASISPFESMLLDSTLVSIPMQAKTTIEERGQGEGDYRAKYNEFINRQLYILNKLDTEVPAIPGPKFVFVHLMIPHPPYVFDPEGNFPSQRGIYADNGSPINDKYYRIGYSNQVTYINNRMLNIIRTIKSESRVPPVILIEGDHGPFQTYDKKPLHRVPENLNAYYLPGAGTAKLYPGISPVNSFRVILNAYFGTDYPLLKDASYPSQTRFYDFQEYTEQSPGCQQK